MEYRSFYIKPVGDGCNMRCSYCEHCQPTWGRMSEQTIKNLLEQACSGTGEVNVHFVFTGGEPMLAGREFFDQFFRAELDYRSERVHFFHTIQTNGLLIDEEWCKFFWYHEYSVELTIDGSELIHDENRKDETGAGTYAALMQKWKLLQRHNVGAMVTCTVTARVARHARVVYDRLWNMRPRQLYFLPCHAPLNSEGNQPCTLTGEAYGEFLNKIFAFWCADCLANRYLPITQFEHYIRLLIGMGASDCRLQGRCGGYLVVDWDGSIYPCEYYTTAEWRMGNVTQVREELFDSEAFHHFIRMSRELPVDCVECAYGQLCHGGCPRNRIQSESGVDNVLCKGLRAFFSNALPALEELARKEISLREEQRREQEKQDKKRKKK